MDGRPLIITDDDGVLDTLLRIAAAAGVEVACGREPEPRAAWRRAGIILLDAALVARAVAAGMPRRPGVVVVAGAPPDVALWEGIVRLGAERTVLLEDADDVLVAVLADAADDPGGVGGDGRTIAVIGACGGAGASVLAASLAMAAQRSGRPVLLADIDPWGAGLDVILGLESTPGVRWSELSAPAGRLPTEALHSALPSVTIGRGRLSVLCHGRPSASVVAPEVVDVVLDSGRRAGDVTVIDLPRFPLEAADRAVERADLTVVLMPADVRACFAADRQIGRLRELGIPLGLVVRGPSPGGLGADDVASVLGIPLLARMRPEPGLDASLEAGRPPGVNPRGPLARASAAVLRAAGVAL